MSSEAAQSDPVNAPAKPCGLPRRLIAMSYDGLLLIGLWMIAAAVVVIPLGSEVDASNPYFQLYLAGVAWAYFAISWRGGQTLGMKAWHVRIEGQAKPIPWLTTVVRFVVALASLGTLGLGFAWSLFHPQSKTWHDLASGTRLVVKKAGLEKKGKGKGEGKVKGETGEAQ